MFHRTDLSDPSEPRWQADSRLLDTVPAGLDEAEPVGAVLGTEPDARVRWALTADTPQGVLKRLEHQVLVLRAALRGALRQLDRSLQGQGPDADTQAGALALAGASDALDAPEPPRTHAFHDGLTGLPNRRAFEVDFDVALQRHAASGQRMGLLCVDLDGCQPLQGDHGQAFSDAVLRIVAARLARALRSQDAVCRQGVDGFICLLPDLPDDEQALAIARKLNAAVAAPCSLQGVKLQLQPSIGVAVYPHDGTTLEALVSRADRAMYWARQFRMGQALSSALPQSLGPPWHVSDANARAQGRHEGDT